MDWLGVIYFMDIKIEHIKDFEKNKDGSYKYYYEFDLYEFSDGLIKFIARSYRDTFEKVSFLKKVVGGKSQNIEKGDFDLKLFKDAAQYLLNEGKKSLFYFDLKEGYVELGEGIF